MDGGYYPQQPAAYQPQQPVQYSDSQRIMYLEQRIAALEARIPRTNLISPRFMQRAWAVFGHYFVSSLVIGLIVGLVMTVISIILTLIFGAGIAAMVPAITEGMSGSGY